MRKLLGSLVLIAGVGGLGYWGATSYAAGIEAQISDAARAVAARSIHGAQSTVAGRDITVSGLADTQAEKDDLIATLDAIEGRRVVIDALDVLPAADPFSFAATGREGRIVGQGNVPTEAMRAALAGAQIEGTESLMLASGAPERWESAVGAGVSAVSQLDEGAMSLTGQELRLSGLVDTPSDKEALLASVILPEGFNLVSEIETRDDGAPVAFDVRYDASGGVEVSGKLPAGLDLAQIASALGLDAGQVSGDATAGLPGTPDAALAALSKIAPWLPEFETATLSARDDEVTVTGEATPGADHGLLERVIGEELDGAARITVAPLSTEPEPSATRTNLATGRAERYTNGYWLPDVPFNPSLAACGTQTEDVLARAKINFLSGSAELGPRAIRAINAMASVLRRCTIEAGLKAEIGGHTDNTGRGNFALSADRAVVVRDAMIVRGVPQEAISAVGFGASKPIADNETQEGRAANRRTTVLWSR